MPTAKIYSEQELVEGLLSREEQAYAYLYDNYAKALFSVIFNVISHQEEAEELLQEVFVKIWQNIDSYDKLKGRIYTWMINIARNHAIDRLRSKSFHQKAKTAELVESVHDEQSGQQSQPKDVGLLKTINKLPEENRKLLELAYFEGYTHDEIARLLNIPLGTVKTRIRTTIIQLRKILNTNHV